MEDCESLSGVPQTSDLINLSVPSEVRASYIVIIDDILANSDLQTISSKRIREGLQKAVDYDITPQKVCQFVPRHHISLADVPQDAIKMIIMDRFDKFAADAKESTTNGHAKTVEIIPTKAPLPKSAETIVHTIEKVGHKRKPSSSRDEDDFSASLSDTASTPPPKKRKSAVDDDAAFAARLQAEENNRARPTRGGTTRKISVVNKKKKTATRISPNDDSGLSGSETGSKRKINRNSGFHVYLSSFLTYITDLK